MGWPNIYSKSEQREPMGMLFAGHELCWAFPHTLRDPATQKDAVIEEELQQAQVITADLAT